MLTIKAATAALWLLALPDAVALLPTGPFLPDERAMKTAQSYLPSFLASGDNDVIVIHQKKAGAPQPDIVRVCIVNHSRSGGQKAFDNNRTRQPRYVVGSGRTDCGDIHPTRQDFYFWKAAPGGPLKPVLKRKLNLSGYAGYLIRFEWIDD
jgi:hypothetical protein